ACVVMASGGYPEKYETGKEIMGLDAKGQYEGVYVYHAGTKIEDSYLNKEVKYLTAGGRVLGVTAVDKTLQGALDKAYGAVREISFEKAHYRRDIGQRALKG
ncbi:MAG TPA: phosphoribosylamine--glycine ligase, partial [Ruminococcaceae bacterium]|nr:phosphoribosylamine--glycine ligase [Oscillospiraceae bacterium]